MAAARRGPGRHCGRVEGTGAQIRRSTGAGAQHGIRTGRLVVPRAPGMAPRPDGLAIRQKLIVC